MGVPGFFGWLIRKYKQYPFILDTINKTDILYIDANGLFHPKCFEILSNLEKDLLNNNQLNNNQIEDKMIKNILEYIDFLINYVKPESTYIAVDGVAPMAKMAQQRKRRFKSILDKHLYDQIKEKHNRKSKYTWSNACITPGTEFMDKLDKHIIKFIKKKNIIYSSYHVPGEGEHKILQHIKQNNKISVIYGLDADLFFLSFASQKPNIYLLREYNQLDIKIDDPTFCLKYVSIDETKKCYNNQIKNLINLKSNNKLDIKDKCFCNDFVFLCYLLGNDFVPHLPSINIAHGGLDTLLDIYTDLYISDQEFIILDSINHNKVKKLLTMLGKLEDEYFSTDHTRKKYNNINNPYNQDIWELENLININQEDSIKLGTPNYRNRYYNYYFENQNIDKICGEYYEGLIWITQYYFNSCTDWRWSYKSHHAPFVSDLANYNYIYKPTKISKPLNIETQLLCVLPPQYSEYLPTSYKSLVTGKLQKYYPYTWRVDCLYKDMFYQCIPLIPAIEIEEILEATKDLTLTKNEKMRFELKEN